MTFNTQSLSAFPSFQELPPKIRDLLYKLVEEDRLNDFGCFKRSPNLWLIFRSDMCASTDDKNVNQSELTTKFGAVWREVTSEQRSQLKQRADAKSAELLKLFPDYQYHPMSSEEKDKWSCMSSIMRKSFWLAAAVRIVERILNPHGEWEGFLSLDQWAQTRGGSEHPDTRPLNLSALKEPTYAPTNAPVGVRSAGPSSYATHQTRSTSPAIHVASAIKKSATRGCGTDSQPGSLTFDTLTEIISGVRNKPSKPQTSNQTSAHHSSNRLPEWLRDFLVPLGAPGDDGKRRRLVLCKFQEQNRTIWVEEEVDDDVPQHIFSMLSQGALARISTRDLVLRDYANPWMPEALDEDQEPYLPVIRDISEYRQYIAAYNKSLELKIPFTWVEEPTSMPTASSSSNTNQGICPSSMTTPGLVVDDSSASRLSVSAPNPTPAPAPVTLVPPFTNEEFESLVAELYIPIAANGQTTTELPQDQMYMDHQNYGVDAGLLGVTDSHQPSTSMALANTPPQPFDPSALETQDVHQQVETAEDGSDSILFQQNQNWDTFMDVMAAV
ncbi:hypothetical protein FRC10_005562 [Ceratobasidium sp. 414]|nr:hypothetical protein FRC10_005562 [Ceratobasidium sp. 414]